MVFMGNIMNFDTPRNAVPALAPPSGVTSNFVDPFSLSPAFVTTAVLCLVLATSAVIVRLAISFHGPEKGIRVEDCMLSLRVVAITPQIIWAEYRLIWLDTCVISWVARLHGQ